VALTLGTSSGGVGRHVRTLASACVAAGAHTSVYGPEATEQLFDFTSAGAQFEPVEIAADLSVARTRPVVLALSPLLRQADIVHAHGVRAGVTTALARGRAGVPLVVTWHNLPLVAGARGQVWRIAGRLLARRAAVSLVVSDDLGRQVRRWGGRDVRLAQVPAPHLQASRDALSVRAELGAEQRPLVLTVSRLGAQKGLPTLVAAAAALAGREPLPLFVIAGDGPEHAELARLAAETGAPVRLLGRRSDVADLLAAADLVVLPSVWEGSPLVAQEALAAGRPLVATGVGGVPGLVGDGAVLIPPADATALAAAIAQLLDQPDEARALASRGQARAATWPTAEEAAAAVLDVYASVLAPSSS
jgi:glycosyltransferase involved in cell wall biosynthesis